MGDRFNTPRFSAAGEERIRLAMGRGHPGDDPRLPLRRQAIRREADRYIAWLGPVDYDGPEETLWEMEIDLDQFSKRTKTPQ